MAKTRAKNCSLASKSRRLLALIILDGLGNNPNTEANAVSHAKTPTLDSLHRSCPYTELITCGERVGLPQGQMGNSEVGHLNIGGGRVIEQELSRINRYTSTNRLSELPVLNDLLRHLRDNPKQALHLIGLLSKGGVHSHIKHLESLITEAAKQGVQNIFIHAITDGRDRPPQAAQDEISEFLDFLRGVRQEFPALLNLRIASMIGRYFAMDRDNRWERTQIAYELFTLGKGAPAHDPLSALAGKYGESISDEFLPPLVFSLDSIERPATIADGDSILFFNFRADRMRQIVSSFCAANFDFFERAVVPKINSIHTLTEYEADFDVEVLFRPQVVSNHLGNVLSKAGLRQLRIAETEKYAHVTYFFNGGVEKQDPGESRILIPSPRDVSTYDQKPQMSAFEVTDALLSKIANDEVDVIILNYANCDMVGHTGNFSAAVKAVEAVDTCLGRAIAAIEGKGGIAIVTADHGNAEQMIDYKTGKPHTFHTTFPVPFFLVGKGFANVTLKQNGSLCDIAPTICELLEISQPAEMTGKSLLL
ncbi:MAG: 2,3-bisphosphoglycerate-independent phosphoglycerate mutase [Deltaproteobacteria bacterium]|nr:2,3-bisphosphoglycerate-independent phosphoglycerate mutase [Deltaproteobacteria bacterium]